EPLLPAPSVCETVTSLSPSPFENVIAELYEPAVQVAALLAATPEPLIVIGRPVSHAPEIVTPLRATVPAAGLAIVIAGPVLSRIKLRLSEPLLPAASVCAAIIFLAPSPNEKFTFTENKPLAQIVVDEAAR